MNLYLLTRDEYKYDEVYTQVIIATNDEHARMLANQNSSFEGRIWTDSEKVDCKEIIIDEELVISRSFHHG